MVDPSPNPPLSAAERVRWRKRTRLLLLVLTFFGLWSWYDLIRPGWPRPAALDLQAQRELSTAPLAHPFRGAHRLAGRVNDPTGRPCPGVWVHLHLMGTAFLAEVVADGDGRFAFADLPAGEATLIVGAPGWVPREFGPYPLRPGEVVTVEVTVERRTEPVVPIRDPVFEENGRPGPRGTLEGRLPPLEESVILEVAPMDPLVRGSRRRVVLDAGAGTYRLAGLLPGSYRLEVLAQRPATDPGLRFERHEGLPIRAGETTHQDLALPLLPVRGQVLAEDRSPVAEALVLVFHERAGEDRTYAGRARTGPDGRFALFPLPAGNLWFHVLAEGHATARVPATLSGANDLQETVIILYRRGG